MKVLIALVSIAVSCLAEPPVENRYLPPQQGLSNGGGSFPPSPVYGAPGSGSGFAAQRQTEAVFRGTPSSSYGAPFSNGRFSSRPSQPSTQYGTPSQFRSSQQRSQFGAARPSNQYGPPRSQHGFRQSQSGLARQTAPSSNYGAPSQQYSIPNIGGNGQASQYTQGGSFSAPSSTYGAPEQSRQYLPPGAGRGRGYAGDADGNGEPASYSFEYMVQDDQSGNDFGHRESREGDRAEGLYYVLLPDGRKQTVEYEADEEGYKPKVTYEDTGAGAGYDRYSQGNGGYNAGGPY